MADVADADQTVAERLSLWLDWTDAHALFDALQAGPAAATPRTRPDSHTRARATIDEVERIRTELARSIDADTVFTDGEADAATCRHHYLAQQRAMEARLEPVRASVRVALSGLSPDLRRLAALDAVLEQALAVRARHLLSRVPALLEQQLARRGQAPQKTPAVDRRFMQGALLAELEMRLQPIEGMMEALAAATAPKATQAGVRHD